MNEMNSYVCATLVGTACGDALGMPFEMKAPKHPMFDNWDGEFIEGTWHKLIKGQWTDDTQMSLALTNSIIRSNGYDPADAAKAYLAWFESDDCRGMGRTTRQALTNLQNGKAWNECGISGPDVGGNGTAMRIAPLGIYLRNDIGKLITCVRRDAEITHRAEEPVVGAIAVAVGIALLANKEAEPYNIIGSVLKHLPGSAVVQHLKVAQRLTLGSVLNTPADDLKVIGTSGYVVETVAAAFYCLANTDSYKEAVVMAVKGGGDADTVAAITGALAGTYYGQHTIPVLYKQTVEKFDMLVDLDAKLWAMGSK